MTDELLYEKRDHVAYLTLNRPESMNAFDPELSRQLRRRVARLPRRSGDVDSDPHRREV